MKPLPPKRDLDAAKKLLATPDEKLTTVESVALGEAGSVLSVLVGLLALMPGG